MQEKALCGWRLPQGIQPPPTSQGSLVLGAPVWARPLPALSSWVGCAQARVPAACGVLTEPAQAWFSSTPCGSPHCCLARGGHRTHRCLGRAGREVSGVGQGGQEAEGQLEAGVGCGQSPSCFGTSATSGRPPSDGERPVTPDDEGCFALHLLFSMQEVRRQVSWVWAGGPILDPGAFTVAGWPAFKAPCGPSFLHASW